MNNLDPVEEFLNNRDPGDSVVGYIAKLIDIVRRQNEALLLAAFNPATNKGWNSHDQLIEACKKLNEQMLKALSDVRKIIGEE